MSKVQLLPRRDEAQVVDRPPNILEGPRIAAARPADAPVLDIPDRDPAPAQVFGDMDHQLGARQAGQPAAPMDHHHHRMRSLAGRRPELAEL